MPLTFNNTNDDTNDNSEVQTEKITLTMPDRGSISEKVIIQSENIDDDGSVFFNIDRSVGGTKRMIEINDTYIRTNGTYEMPNAKEELIFKREAALPDATTTFEADVVFRVGLNSDQEENVLRHGAKVFENNMSLISNADPNDPTKFNINGSTGEYRVLTYNSLFAGEIVIPKFHEIVLQGCVNSISNFDGVSASNNTYSTTFQNPVRIHKNTHKLSFHTGQASMLEDETQENSFDVDCESTFSRDITLQQTADLVFPIATLLSGLGDPIFNTKYTNEIQDYTALNVKVNATVNPFGAATSNNLTFQGYISKLVKDLTVPEEQQQFSPTTFPASGTEIMFTLPSDYCPPYRIVFTNISSFTDLNTDPPTQGPNATVIVESSGSVIFDANATVLANNNNAHNIIALNFNPSLVYYNNIEPVVYSLYKSGVSIATSIQSSTVLFDENSTWNNTSSTLPIGVYIVYIEQTGGTPDGTTPNNDLWQLAARFPLIIHTATTNDTNGPAQELQGVVFTHANNHNGDIRFYFEHGNTTTTPRTPWKVHMIFSQVNSTNDTANFNIKLKKENW